MGKVYLKVHELNGQEVDDFANALLRDAHEWIIQFYCCPGGDESYSWAIYDMILAAQKRGVVVLGFAWGELCSAAVLPFLACSIRAAGDNTAFMVHLGAREYSSASQKKIMDRYDKVWCDAMAANSTTSRRSWARMVGKDESVWLDANDMLKKGALGANPRLQPPALMTTPYDSQ